MVSVKAIAVVLASTALAACGAQVSLLALDEVQPGVLEIAATCADDVSVKVEETTSEVRITDVTGVPIDGDCGGGVTVELEAPLGDRDVVVNGERWVRLAPSCPWGSIGPTDLDERCPPA